MEREGRIELVITQNVDRLHQRAGSKRVIDLHGRLDRVRCLDCANLIAREDLQTWLITHNELVPASEQQSRPDGDRDLSDDNLATFRVPHCNACTGVLMPEVVFFGGTVPAARVESCKAAIERADALLVIGSSLKVYSGYRFCRHAQASGKPIAIINPGISRADDLADIRFNADAGQLLPAALAMLNPQEADPYAHDNPS